MDPRLTDMKIRVLNILNRIDYYQLNYKNLLETIEAVESELLPEDTVHNEIGRLINLIEGAGTAGKGSAWN